MYVILIGTDTHRVFVASHFNHVDVCMCVITYLHVAH